MIQFEQLTRTYGDFTAVHPLTLSVSSGEVFGFLGPNGAGKTTTIRLLAGLLRPTAGRAEVLGHDVVADREGAQRHIGYLPGEFVGYHDLTVEQYLRYLGNLRGGVSWQVADGFAKRLDLDVRARIGALSHGNRQKVGIVQAFMSEPDLLILDEPTTGLDPLVQREFLALVREARDQGRTVFLSSHILDEVEAVADMVGILRLGQLAVVETVEALKSRALRRLDLTFQALPPLAALRTAKGVREATAAGNTVHLAVEGTMADLFRLAAPAGIQQVVTHEPDLEEIFLTYYGREG
jgi:ABC-2 type transport system ATP-binding protein